jgi:hypothetical protein
MNLEHEPAALTTALSAAVIATINVIGMVMAWSNDVVAAVNIAAAGWIVVLGFWIRSKVVPVRPLQEYADAVEAARVPEFP